MRKCVPYKVLTTALAAAVLFGSTGSAEELQDNPVPAPSVEDIVSQGQKIFMDMQKETAAGAVDKLGYKDFKEKAWQNLMSQMKRSAWLLRLKSRKQSKNL